MTHASSNQPFITRWWVRLLVVVLGLVLLVVIATSVKVVETAGKQEVQPADAIVVFGAAEYAGRPSPVWRARLDHAFALYQRGVAPVIITTGGAAADPHYSEGGVGRDYLMHRGVPERSLIAEMQGRDTSESAERVAVIMRANHLEHEGIGPVYTAPRLDTRPHSLLQRAGSALRESVSYLLWRIGIP